jgi:hypothetical protein
MTDNDALDRLLAPGARSRSTPERFSWKILVAQAAFSRSTYPGVERQ